MFTTKICPCKLHAKQKILLHVMNCLLKILPSCEVPQMSIHPSIHEIHGKTLNASQRNARSLARAYSTTQKTKSAFIYSITPYPCRAHTYTASLSSQLVVSFLSRLTPSYHGYPFATKAGGDPSPSPPTASHASGPSAAAAGFGHRGLGFACSICLAPLSSP